MKLAIDTSTDTASIALVEEDRVLAELTWHCGHNHTTQLLPNLAHLLRETGLSLKSIRYIIVARGPGSFNGLRVGIGTAKGFALSLGIPIIGISTLEVEAYPHAETGLPTCPVVNAGRGEIAAALYQQQGDRWLNLMPEHITTVDALCARIATETLFCGEYIPAIAARIKAKTGQYAVVPPPATRIRRAGFLAELGQRRIAKASYDNPATLQPLYLRRPPITKSKRQLANWNGGIK